MSVFMLPDDGYLRGATKDTVDGSGVVMVIGFLDCNGTAQVIYVAADGSLHQASLDKVTIDWRYDVEKDAFIDVGTSAPDEDI